MSEYEIIREQQERDNLQGLLYRLKRLLAFQRQYSARS